MKIRRQLATADGLIGYTLNARLTRKEFWTVSVWRTKDDLERFASADPHVTISRTKHERTGQSQFVFWTCRGDDLPIGWSLVAEHLEAPVDAA
jgi:heme-degrading monooxygenase HmoA